MKWHSVNHFKPICVNGDQQEVVLQLHTEIPIQHNHTSAVKNKQIFVQSKAALY